MDVLVIGVSLHFGYAKEQQQNKTNFSGERKQMMIRRSLLAAAAAVVILTLQLTAHADPLMLGPAAGYSVLGISSVTINNSDRFAVRGNVGVGGGNGSLQKATVDGNVVIANGANPSISGKDFIVSGSITTGADLSSAINAAVTASRNFAGLTATQTFTNITSDLTIVGGGGQNVISVNSIDLNGANLTLSGGANDVFVINITGDFQLSHAQIVLSGVSLNNVLFNVIGTGPTVDFHKADTAVFGTVLAVDRDLIVDNAGLVVHGEIIANNITIHSGGQVVGETPVPEPTTMLLLGTGLAGIAAKVRRRRTKAATTEA